MYPYPVYISYGDNHTNFRKVMITGYTDAISIGSFNNLNLKVPYDLAHKEKINKGYKPWKHTYHVKWYSEWETDLKILEEQVEKYPDIFERRKIVGDPINLMDFYKEIGYDHRIKHLNNKTLRQHVIDEIKREENDN